MVRGGAQIKSFDADGPSPQELAAIIRKYPNYYALGTIGPDIFFLLPDFKGKMGNFIARLAEWVIKFYDELDEKVLKPWEDTVGPIEEDTTEELSRLTGGLTDEISRIANYASGIISQAVLGFASRLYDWFGIFGSGVAPGYDDKLFFWSDMFHYRRTNEFARDLLERAQNNAYGDKNTQGNRYKYEPGIAFALGWMTHIGTDVTGHAFVNEKSGGPYRLHWQRHHLVENHMDAYVYNDEWIKHPIKNPKTTEPLYNMLSSSALHFWIQFNNDGTAKYDYFNLPDTYDYSGKPAPSGEVRFPVYPTGLKARDYFDRKNAFDVDTKLPAALANFLLDTMKVTFYDRHNEDNNDNMATHPMILAAVTSNADGRPDTDLMNTTYELLYRFVKYTTTDHYKMPKPQPPDVFPNLNPPIPPGSNDDAPSEKDDAKQPFWQALLAIFAWILYIGEWIAYLVTILPSIIADLATYPARYVLYLFEEPLYELWKAFRSLLVMEGFIMPEPDEIDLGLVKLGLPSNGPYHQLFAYIDDVFGGWLGDDPIPVPLSEPVADPQYPRQTVRDPPDLIKQFVGSVESQFEQRCGMQPPTDPRQPSEFLRPWEYPLLNNKGEVIGREESHSKASPHIVGELPTVLFGSMPGINEARMLYEQAATPDETDRINAQRLNKQWNMGDPIFYSLYVMGQLTRNNVNPAQVNSFNLDADRGYGYKCWDWNRHTLYKVHYNGDPAFEYPLPCTPTLQFNKYDVCGTNTPTTGGRDPRLEYDPNTPLLIHYLAMLKKGVQYPRCTSSGEVVIG